MFDETYSYSADELAALVRKIEATGIRPCCVAIPASRYRAWRRVAFGRKLTDALGWYS